MSATVRVIDAGMASTVQDRGRAGHAHLGVPPSGAVDPALAALVNRLVGNPEDAAVIETCGGLRLEVGDAALVATTLEAVPRSTRAGATIAVPPGHGRVWHYVAVRGGFAVEPVLGSRSTDTLSGLGPAPLAAGDVLPVGPDPGTPFEPGHAPLRPLSGTARVVPGPRSDWFEQSAIVTFASHEWRITAASRVGVRLAGARLKRTVTVELPSEGLVRGAIQVPPDGDPVMMLADHPTTGGYPVVAVVHPDDVAEVAQTPAGQRVRFRFS